MEEDKFSRGKGRKLQNLERHNAKIFAFTHGGSRSVGPCDLSLVAYHSLLDLMNEDPFIKTRGT